MASTKIFVESSLGPDVLVLRHMSGREELGGLYGFELELQCTRRDLAPKDLLGKDMTVHMDLPGGGTRHFHGFVSELVVTGTAGRTAEMRATLRPFFWFLTRTSNSRIFQNATVPDILKQVFEERGLSEVEDALSGSYAKLEYVVQYRESDFNFVSRLMEQEGIYYFFRHEAGKHTLVLCDAADSHQSAPGYEEVPYYPPDGNARRERECVDGWQLQQHIQPGTYVLDDYDFKRPRAELLAKLAAPRPHDHADYEVFDYPGKYVQASDGENYARIRLEELHKDFERTSAQGNTRGLATGIRFKLAQHPRADQNGEYLITSASYDLSVGGLESGSGGDEHVFRMGFTAIKADAPFRPSRGTPRPVVHGPQTARVVGKSGEEIWTDEHGRVKVRFHWDRGDTSDENSSCWVRVSQTWAGAGWGAMHVPRIGQEVVVSFLEGDPDRPIITGRVYNGSNRPPFALPGAGMVSGIKSDSTPGGGGNNELSFDDTKGAEKITIHGQYDMATTVGHDQANTIGNNRTTSVGVNDTEDVGGDQTLSVTGNQSVTVAHNQSVSINLNQDEVVGVNQTVSVGANQTVTVGANQDVTIGAMASETVALLKSVTVGAAYQVSVGAAMNETVGAAKIEEVGGAKSVNVGAVYAELIGGSKSVTSGGKISQTSASDTAIAAGGNLTVQGKSKGVIELGSELTIKVGSATIVLKKSGDITIKGAKISIHGSGAVDIKGDPIKQN